MNAQEIFDKVATHLATQKVASFQRFQGCLYRGPNGTMCAVGCLIPDSMFSPDFERLPLPLEKPNGSDALRLYEAVEKLGLAEFRPLLRDLQRVHDKLMPRPGDDEEAQKTGMREVQIGLKLLANQHGLQYDFELVEGDPGLRRIEHALAY